jgi:hypothetical protein
MTVVNPQITDAVTQANVKALGEAPAMAMGAIYQTLAQSVGLAMHNAVAAQQQMNTIAQAATVQGIATLYSLDTAATAEGVQKILKDSTAAVKAALPAVDMSVHRVAQPDDVAYGTRALADAFAASLHAIGEATTHNLLRILQIAATSACITAMIAQPEKTASYEDVLAAIKKIA